MRIRALILRPFRNISAIRLNFAADYALIFGPNVRGKSNILEAISYLSIGKSARGAKDSQAVPHGKEFFDIQAICTDERHDHQLRIFYDKKEGKKAFVDANPPTKSFGFTRRIPHRSFLARRCITGFALPCSAKASSRYTYFAV